jgi:hypothetical protein
MYLLPFLEVTGYLPGRSVAIRFLSSVPIGTSFSSSVVLIVKTPKSCSLVRGEILGSLLGSPCTGTDLVVTLMPCRTMCKCPFAVCSNGSKYFLTRFVVKPGHPI